MPEPWDGRGGGSGLTTSPAARRDEAEIGRRGGRLRIAVAVGGSSDTQDPNAQVSDDDVARSNQIFDRLAVVAPDGSIRNELAESFEHDADATEWTICLRPGVTWHGGSALTADDVLYTVNRMGARDSALTGKSVVAAFDVKRARKLDRRTLRLHLHVPIANLAESFVGYFMAIVKDGQTDFSRPIGTGAFKMRTYKAGESALLVRNPDYWVEGRPYVDELELTIIGDASARLNALLSGRVDGLESLSYAQAKAHQQGAQLKVLEAPHGATVPLTMACDAPPFDDVRVRQAMRLIAGRPQLSRPRKPGSARLGTTSSAREGRTTAASCRSVSRTSSRRRRCSAMRAWKDCASRSTRRRPPRECSSLPPLSPSKPRVPALPSTCGTSHLATSMAAVT